MFSLLNKYFQYDRKYTAGKHEFILQLNNEFIFVGKYILIIIKNDATTVGIEEEN